MECLHTNSFFDIFYLISLQHGRIQSFHGNAQCTFVIFCRFGYSLDVKIQTMCMTALQKYNIHSIFHVNKYRTYMVIMYPFVLQGNQVNNICVYFTQ